MKAAGLGRTLMVVATVVVVATLAAALLVMESPSKQRERRIDQRRTGELTAIADAIDAWVLARKALPASLAELARQPGLSLPIVDPVDAAPYGYAVVSARAYRLCANFATSTADPRRGAAGRYWTASEWRHPAGPHCFERTAGDAEQAAAAAAVVP